MEGIFCFSGCARLWRSDDTSALWGSIHPSKMLCTYVSLYWLPGNDYEGLPFVQAKFWAGQDIFDDSETFLIIGSNLVHIILAWHQYIEAFWSGPQYIKVFSIFQKLEISPGASECANQKVWEAILVDIRPFYHYGLSGFLWATPDFAKILGNVLNFVD